jgi:catechol 2,3-dioxygenase-like lactoylglutathione lyase family enzyme
MAISGIESLVYAVDDVAESARFFTDFGLKPDESAPDGGAVFLLADQSSVVLLPHEHPALPRGGQIEGTGVHEVIWSVDSEQQISRLAEKITTVTDVVRDGDTSHFVAPFGVPMGLRVTRRKPVVCAPDLSNAPGHIRRLNQHRKWRRRAVPKAIAHVVFSVPGYETAYRFMIDVLDFRLTDSQRGFGKYLRASGTNNHHNFLLLNADAPLPDMDGVLRFHHSNFAVEDIDEIMLGANHMARKGWEASHFGLGRHRIDSALFYYIPCPAGGEAEYGADSDYVDDGWVPRDWDQPLFGYSHFVHDLPPFLAEEPVWHFNFMTGDDATGGAA